MHILVTGAGGYVGFQVAQALRRSGHIVYGLARKDEDLRRLAACEIVPVKADQSDGKSLPVDVLDKVSVVIDTVLNYTDNPPLVSNRILLLAVQESSKRTKTKRRYIYTSGGLIYGDHGNQLIDETFEPKAPMPRVAWEREVLAVKDVDTVVIRPGLVYGGSGNKYMADLWQSNAQGDIEVKGNPHKLWSWIHLFDLANAYVVIAEATAGAVGGQIFDVAGDTRLTVEQAQVLLARAAGVKGKVVYSEASKDFWSQLKEASALFRADKIRRLGWQPRMGPLSDSVHQVFLAQQASNASK